MLLTLPVVTSPAPVGTTTQPFGPVPVAVRVIVTTAPTAEAVYSGEDE
jgi:hypothetical protein